MKKFKIKSLVLVGLLVFGLGFMAGCSNNGDDDNPFSPGSGGAEMENRMGTLEISVGSGSTPQISWTGGKISVIGVVKGSIPDTDWEDFNEGQIIWLIGDEDLQDDLSAPITYGECPEGTTDATVAAGGQHEATLQTGQRYAIVVAKAAWEGTEEDTANYGAAEFVR